MSKSWKGNRYLAKCCNTTIQSQYSGQFVRCNCGKSAVDETPYYCRFIGNRENIEIILDKIQDAVVKLETEN